MQRSQCAFSISFVSCRKTFDLFVRGRPPASTRRRSASRAFRKKALSGVRERMNAANVLMPAAVQKSARHDVCGTRYSSITAAIR
jgi:hypothetical protein